MCLSHRKVMSRVVTKVQGLVAYVLGGVLPYMGYIGMCRCEGYGFQAVYSGIRLLLAGSLQQHDANYCGPVTVPPLMRGRTPHWGLHPLLFTNSVWVLKRPTDRIDIYKGYETGPMVYCPRPYPRRLESVTVFRCYYKGSTFSSVI